MADIHCSKIVIENTVEAKHKEYICQKKFSLSRGQTNVHVNETDSLQSRAYTEVSLISASTVLNLRTQKQYRNDMIHELIDPKKKTNRASGASKNTKTFQEPKTISEEINFEGSDSENKESSSTIFIPPWLRNSLGLNQRNNLSHATGSSDLKSAKLIQRGKESSQNEFDSLKSNIVEQVSCKKVTEHFEILPQDCPQEESIAQGSDNADTADNSNERTVPMYWDVKCKESETEWSCTNADTKPLKKEESRMTSAEVLTAADIGKLKEEDKRRLKFIKQKNKMRKRMMCESKQSELDRNEVDILLQMKAREALDNYMKGDVHSVSSEMRHLEANLLLLSAKSHDLRGSKLNQQDIRMLQEVKNQVGSVEELERVFEHLKDVNLRGVMRNSEFPSKNLLEKKQEAKAEKCIREVMQNEDKCRQADKECLPSTDDENDIKRFSEILSKNKNLDEKRKCLEEVRNYFERKRRTRLTKRRFLEEGKAKANFQGEGKEEHAKEKVKPREVYRGRRSKFALCDEEVVEKAVDEALQKFVELYHFRVSPSVMGNMKKNILEAIATDSLDNAKLKESALVALEGKKINLDLLSLPDKEPEKGDAEPLLETEITEVPNRDSGLPKEAKKKNTKNESLGEQVPKLVLEAGVMENEKLKRLRKEFDIFLNSVQTHIDVTNVKLQSIILEKEEQMASPQNVQFVYNFTKKALEQENADYWQSLKETLDFKSRRDIESQTVHMEPARRNVKIQVLEQKTNEQSLQTEAKVLVSQETQTDGDGLTVREIKELRSYDVNPGLYRMVRSKEAGKFYLYPEQLEDRKHEVCEKSNSSVVKDKKFNKKRNVVNILSKERTKERQMVFREREKGKLRKSKKTPVYAVAQLKGTSTRKKKKDETSENSISCLYFKNFDKKGSDSISSKKEVDLTDENLTERLEVGEDLRLEQSKEEHLGCFWFWDGEKISPGCDLKKHVESLLKEKLSHITNFGGNQNESGVKGLTLSKKESQHLLTGKASEKNLDVKSANAIFCFSSVRNLGKESAFAENESLNQKKRALGLEEKKEENGETEENAVSVSQESPVKNVATQDSHLKFVSLNLSKHRTRSGSGTTVRRKCTKRNIVINPSHGKVVNIRKAQDFLRAIEEIKKIKLELANSKKVNPLDSESLLECSSSTSCCKHPTEDPLSMVLGLKGGTEVEEIFSSEIKNKVKNLMSLVDREVQTTDLYDPEDGNSGECQRVTPALDSRKHLDLIGRVLSGVSQRQKENLWNDVRHFIKTKIGKDINDEGTSEVCIEIEQDMPKAEQGKVKHSILAKGHYSKDEGDVEVEIDLSLDDLARILRQRQKKIRRRNMYRSNKSKNFLSSSSAQSDLTGDDIRRYQRFLHKFAALGHGQSHGKDPKAFKKNKGI